ncbi:hypothetical protein ACFWPK_02295 [Nocardia sp. NPDC058519]|uniref:hypothetical protein n=1 Tax=Nocardia sp. NPDC058519 TaxID=3346535 RepID=UPI0036471CD5
MDRGLLDKRADPEDGRSYRLHETELAEHNNRLIDDMWTSGIRRLLDEMTPEEAAKLTEAAALLARLGAMSGPGTK